MNISKIFGLPAHPLFVHVPIVLIPLTAIGVVAMACSARVRERFGWLVLAIGMVAGISTQFAIDSGQSLRDSVPKSDALRRHVQIAESIRPLILLLFVVAAVIMVIDRRARGAWPFARSEARPQAPKSLRIALAALAVVMAFGTTARLFQIGDSGAKATWQRVHLRSNGDRERR